MKKATKFLSGFLAVLLVLSVTACSSVSESDEPTPPTPNDRKDIILSRSEAEIVECHNEFALRFYNATCAERNSDVSVSPLSMSMFLSILANGAAGETRKEIVEALGFKDSDMDAVNTFNNRLVNELTVADNTVELTLANSIWVDDDAKVLEGFLQENKTAYDADIFVADFADPTTKDAINAWCSEKTKGVINEFIGEREWIRPTGVLTYNATYFNGYWSTPFDKAKTKKRTFKNYTKDPEKVDMMNGEFEAYYKDIDGTQVVCLPYGNGAFEMVLFILEDNSSHYPESFLRKQNAQSLKTNIPSGFQYEIDLTLPKVRLDFDYSRMIQVLEHLGINNLSDGDFSAMVEGGSLPAMTLKHKTTISIDEKGTEGAAVTGNIVWGSAGPDQPVPETKKIVVDSPFEYLIRETSTKAILFIGSVHNIMD